MRSNKHKRTTSRKSKRPSRFFSKSFIIGRRQQRYANRRANDSVLLQEEGLMASSTRGCSVREAPLRRTLSHDASNASSRVSQGSNIRYSGRGAASTSYASPQSMMDLQAEVVQNLQWILGYILSCIGAYFLGVHQPFQWLNHDILYHVGLMVIAAWLTCSIIRVVTWWIHVKNEQEEDESIRIVEEEEEEALLQSLHQDEESYPFEDIYGSMSTVKRGQKIDLGVISPHLSLEDADLNKEDSFSLSEDDLDIEKEFEFRNTQQTYDLSGGLEMNGKMECKSKKL